MKNSIFQLPKTLPGAARSVPVFRTAYTADYFRKRAYIQHKTEIIRSFGRLLNVEGEPVEQGPRMIMINPKHALEVYHASDSLWFTDRKLANNENPELSKNLLDERTAAAMAVRQLEELGLAHSALRTHSISYTTLAVARSPREKPEEYRTELHNNFVFELEKLPVFGPGAKVKVSYANGKQLSDLYYFWRNTEMAGETRIISPERALDILSRNARFARLKDGCQVHYSSIQLGYYAASPDKIQTALIPVYCVKGEVRTPALPKYEFTLYVHATASARPEQAKAKGSMLGPTMQKVF